MIYRHEKIRKTEKLSALNPGHLSLTLLPSELPDSLMTDCTNPSYLAVSDKDNYSI